RFIYAKSGGGLGHSRHGGLLLRRGVRVVHTRLAAPDRPAPALVGVAADVHHPGGGGFGRRVAHRSHPRARPHRRSGDVGGFGVRVHHARDAHQRSANHRPGGFHRVHRPAARHANRVRSFVVPAILSILGPWFWWPTLVRSRPLRQGSPPHL